MLDRAIRCCTDLDTLIQKASALTDAEVPTTTAAWVSPVDATRSALAGSKTASGRWNTGIGDLTAFNPGNSAWIDQLNLAPPLPRRSPSRQPDTACRSPQRIA